MLVVAEYYALHVFIYVCDKRVFLSYCIFTQLINLFHLLVYIFILNFRCFFFVFFFNCFLFIFFFVYFYLLIRFIHLSVTYSLGASLLRYPCSLCLSIILYNVKTPSPIDIFSKFHYVPAKMLD